MQHFFSTVEQTMKSHWDRPSLCDFRGISFTNSQIAESMAKFQLVFEAAGIKPGDKIAICAKNTSHWSVVFLSILAYKAVAVPILSDFIPESITHLVDHSESLLLFVDKSIWDKLDSSKMPKLRGAVDIDDYTLLFSSEPDYCTAYQGKDAAFAKAYPKGITAADFSLPTDNMDELAIINYTSGTTSAPKGVMLTFRNLSASVAYALVHVPVTDADTFVSMLPLAHIYGLVFQLLYPLAGGSIIYFLGKVPAPSYLLQAMKEVRPYMICTVPLVMEKIFNSSLKPVLSKWYMKLLLSIPGLNQILYGKIRDKFDAAFGGRCRHYIMGGAAVNPEVEKWFKRLKLKYSCGYGMTEAAPLLAYEDWREFAPGSCGKPVECAVVRIDSADQQHIVGEIQAKGENIFVGYYRNEQATKASFTEDGFLRTGDLGIIDKDGNVFIKGRSKSMILSSNGQNIYPEEMEAVVNNQPFVSESVVVDRDGKLVALVYLDADAMHKAGLDEKSIEDLPDKIRLMANRKLPSYSLLSKVERSDSPFEKTPKMSIKRFLYK